MSVIITACFKKQEKHGKPLNGEKVLGSVLPLASLPIIARLFFIKSSGALT